MRSLLRYYCIEWFAINRQHSVTSKGYSCEPIPFSHNGRCIAMHSTLIKVTSYIICIEFKTPINLLDLLVCGLSLKLSRITNKVCLRPPACCLLSSTFHCHAVWQFGASGYLLTIESVPYYKLHIQVLRTEFWCGRGLDPAPSFLLSLWITAFQLSLGHT